MKRLLLILIVLCLNYINLFCQPKKFIPIVKPMLYEKTKESFESIAKRFEDDNYKELGEIFRSFANGGHGSGFVFVDEDGENYIITNKHVVSSSEKVNLEFIEKGSTKTVYESCPIVYTDDDIDLAILKFPNNEKIFKKAFPLTDEKQPEGKEIWSAGYPGLLGKPMWQFSKGNITNEEAYVEELISPDISYLIQHSASIDPGNSGGPLLIKNGESRTDYVVIGVNTWTISNRQNTFFSIPSTTIPGIIKKAKAIVDKAGNSDSLTFMLDEQCKIFAAEINSEKPKWEKVNNFISYLFVADKGWDSFLKVISQNDEEITKRLEKSFFNYSPVEAMRYAILYRIWEKWNYLRKDKLNIDIVYNGINVADKGHLNSEKSIRTNFTVNGVSHEISWSFEHGHWRISNYNLEKTTDSGSGKSSGRKSKKDQDGSFVYLGLSAHGVPFTYCDNSLLNDNFKLMGLGGTLTLNFGNRSALYLRVTKLGLNNKMKDPPPTLKSATVEYLHVNHGFIFSPGDGKLKPYFMAGINYIKFSETGSTDNISVTNEFETLGSQFGLGLKYKLNNHLSLFTDATYNCTSIIPFLTEETDDMYSDLTNVQLSVGISFDLKKK